MPECTLLLGDCRVWLAGIPENSLDACVTDPPYELGFMGRAWDRSGIANDVALWRAVYRVLKPGAYLAAFGGTRTYHRMVCAIEDAGLEIRDTLQWIYGSGFPKSLDVGKALDRAAGAERAVVGTYDTRSLHDGHRRGQAVKMDNVYHEYASTTAPITAPATDAARQWAGWGTALKPAHEPIVLARKPLVSTVAANVAAWGTGAINVDGCRVGTNGGGWNGLGDTHNTEQWRLNAPDGVQRSEGRWPPNLLLTHDPACNGQCVPGCPVAVLDGQAGPRKSGAFQHRAGEPVNSNWRALEGRVDTHRHSNDHAWQANEGNASRFYPILNYTAADFLYCAKASRAERNRGCADLPQQRSVDSDWVSESRKGAASGGVTSPQGNHHPTVKPLALLRWLTTLITPPGGTVLDPFMGSGSEGVVCIAGGWGYVGMEQDADHLAIARARTAQAILDATPQPTQATLAGVA